jgi:hypothetical protein
VSGTVALVADDYGYRPGVSAAIRRLVAAGRLDGASALVTFPDWGDAARHVGEMREWAAIGLHLDLVEGRPRGPMRRFAPDGRFPPIGELIRRAVSGSLDRVEIRDEVSRQIEAYARAAGVAPDYLDGHQHGHALPLVRDAVFDALDRAGLAGLPLRDPADRFERLLARPFARKAATIALAARGFAKAARARGFPVNDGFSGVTDFAPGAPLAEHFAGFLRQAGPRHLVMVHPGDDDDGMANDPIRHARPREAAVIGEGAFDRAVAAAGLVRARPAAFT